MTRSKTTLLIVTSLLLLATGYSIANFRRANQAEEKIVLLVEIKKHDRVTTNKNLDAYPPTEGGDINSVIDDQPNTWWYASMLPGDSTFAELVLKKPEVISKVSISFMDRYATGFMIYFKYDDDWVLAKEVIDNKSESINVIIDKENQIKTPAVRVVFFKTSASDNLASIREVKLFKPLISP